MNENQLTNLTNTEGGEIIGTISLEDIEKSLTIKETLAAYALAGTFIVGAMTIGYATFVGGRKLGKKIKQMVVSKKAEQIQESEEEIQEEEE